MSGQPCRRLVNIKDICRYYEGFGVRELPRQPGLDGPKQEREGKTEEGIFWAHFPQEAFAAIQASTRRVRSQPWEVKWVQSLPRGMVHVNTRGSQLGSLNTRSKYKEKTGPQGNWNQTLQNNKMVVIPTRKYKVLNLHGLKIASKYTKAKTDS